MAAARDVSLVLLLPWLLAACVRQDVGPATVQGHPQPTEHWLDADAEERQAELRKAWFEERHKAPPEVDWRAVEQRNGLAQTAKRNQRAVLGLSAPGRWVERGSENQAGRMHVAALSSDGTALYAGSSKGGVWKGTLDGASWTPIGDNLYGGAHWLAVVPGDGPGDPDAVLAATDGGLVHVTRDEGASWEVPLGLGSTSSVRRVLVTSDGTDTVFVLLRSNGFFRLFRSTDGMHTFQEVRNLGGYPGDVWTPRNGGAEVYLLTQSNLQRSSDMGSTWSVVGTLPGGAERGELCGSEAGAPRLWSVLRIGGQYLLHRSDDGGASWSQVATITDYWGSLNASIFDANLFAYGGVELFRTCDGGASFSKQNNWYDYYGDPANRLHADIPGIDVLPHGPSGETWYVDTDGGLFRSQDGLGSVFNLSLLGLRVSQYYTTHTSAMNPLHVVAGSQDQGYQRAFQPPGAGARLDFDQLISGDYGHLTSGDGSHEYLFSVYPGFVLIQQGEDAPQLYTANFPGGETYAWMPPVVADPLDRRDFFLCATQIHRYDKAPSSSSWSSSPWSSFDFEGSAGEYVSALVFSPVDPQRAYAATSHGRLFHSDDRGVTWTPSASSGPTGQYFYGTALLASSADRDVVWVGGSGYGGPAVFESTDGGATFQAFGQGLPSTLVYCLGEAPDGSGTLFCGTETAAYERSPGGAAWRDATDGEAPVTTYWSVEALPDEDAMRFGTYGRGIWDLRVLRRGHAARYGGPAPTPVHFGDVDVPVLGQTWTAAVDARAFPGAEWVGIVVYAAPAADRVGSAGVSLVDMRSARLLRAVRPAGEGVVRFALAIPDEPGLRGERAYAQSFVVERGRLILGDGLELLLGDR